MCLLACVPLGSCCSTNNMCVYRVVVGASCQLPKGHDAAPRKTNRRTATTATDMVSRRHGVALSSPRGAAPLPRPTPRLRQIPSLPFPRAPARALVLSPPSRAPAGTHRQGRSPRTKGARRCHCYARVSHACHAPTRASGVQKGWFLCTRMRGRARARTCRSPGRPAAGRKPSAHVHSDTPSGTQSLIDARLASWRAALWCPKLPAASCHAYCRGSVNDFLVCAHGQHVREPSFSRTWLNTRYGRPLRRSARSWAECNRLTSPSSRT